MLFAVIAELDDDPKTMARLDAVRPVQMEAVRQMAADGSMWIGGATTDPISGQKGSLAIVDFPSRVELDRWIARHPYKTAGLWKHVRLLDLAVAPVFQNNKSAG